jgi:hypothetical protein
MNLSIAWVPPVPAPTCGYKALYRAKGQTTYTEISASGTTATVVLSAPACYEGLVKSDYCSGNTASGMPFGVNAYGEFSVAVVLNDSGEAEVTISSTYASPYDLMVTGTFDGTANLMTTTYPFSDITLSAGETSYTEIVTAPLPGSPIISNIVVTSFSSVFNEGGQLQQLDPVSTPEYFQFYWDQDGEPAFDGAPISLPSFTLDSFTITEQDISGNPTAGTLNFSYIVPDTYVPPFNLVELIATDGTGTVGTTIVSIEGKGVTNASIDIVITGSLLDNREMVAYWPDTTLITQKEFHLPTV